MLLAEHAPLPKPKPLMSWHAETAPERMLALGLIVSVEASKNGSKARGGPAMTVVSRG